MGVMMKNLRVDHVVHTAVVAQGDQEFPSICSGRTVCDQYERWDEVTFDFTKGASFVEEQVTCLMCLIELR